MFSSAQELLVVLGVAAVVLLFGASAIPKLAKNLGRAKGEFKKGVKDGEELAGDSEDEGGPDRKSVV